MKRAILLNMFFVILFVIFLIISLMTQFFFFLPIFCIFPFACKSGRQHNDEQYSDKVKRKDFLFDTNQSGVKLQICPQCGGEIKEPTAQYCYHCGKKLE